MKSFYNILKKNNYWFAIYYIYYKKKHKIIKLIYNLWYFFRSKSLRMIEI